MCAAWRPGQRGPTILCRGWRAGLVTRAARTMVVKHEVGALAKAVCGHKRSLND